MQTRSTWPLPWPAFADWASFPTLVLSRPQPACHAGCTSNTITACPDSSQTTAGLRPKTTEASRAKPL